MRPKRILAAAAIGVFLLSFSAQASAQLQIFNINDGDVAGLRSAITTSNSDGLDDIINLATNGVYTITSADPSGAGFPAVAFDNGHHVTIHGHGATIQRSSAAADFNLFVSNGFLSMDGLTFASGANNTAGVAGSGEIDVQNCSFAQNRTGLSVNYRAVVTDCTFTAGTVLGISNAFGVVTVLRGTFQGQQGIANQDATLTVTDSSFTGCTFPALLNEAVCNNSSCAPSIATVTGCTFSGNSSGSDGGAIDNLGSTLHVTNSTFATNTAVGNGGAINNAAIAQFTIINTYVDSAASTSLLNCSFSGNSAAHGGAVADAAGLDPFVGVIPGTLTLANTILQTSNGSGGTVYTANGTAAVTSGGHNIADDAAGGDSGTGPGGMLNAAGDMRNTNPLFVGGTPADNGGPTETLAIGIFGSSPAINHGDDSLAPHRDQRGYFRTGQSDVGAFEYNGGLVGTSSIVRSGNDLIISAEVVYGHSYQLERKLNLTDTSWTTIGNEFTATGDDTEPAPTASGDFSLGRAFYHVRFTN